MELVLHGTAGEFPNVRRFWFFLGCSLARILVAAEPPALKPAIVGLVAMGDIGFHRHDGGVATNSLAPVRAVPGILSGVVINITWEQLEPTRGELRTQEIDRFLDEIRSYNGDSPARPLAARLRVWPGPTAPAWAKALGGSPVTVLHKDIPITVGRYWTKPYREAWRDLQRRLAARYDAEPLIREVTNTSGSSITDEPFIVAGDPVSLKNLLAAGFNDHDFHQTLAESVDDYSGWRTTRVEWSCSPYRAMDSGRPKPQPEITLQLMRQWRERLGPRGILGNHALNQPIAPQLQFIYDELRRLGPPNGVQTQAPAALDWDGAVKNAAAYRIQAVEVWTSNRFPGFEKKDPAALRRWAGQLR